MWSLTLLYLVTAVCVVALYGACRWYVERKKASQSVLVRLV
jgi:hypothetical protein